MRYFVGALGGGLIGVLLFPVIGWWFALASFAFGFLVGIIADRLERI